MNILILSVGFLLLTLLVFFLVRTILSNYKEKRRLQHMRLECSSKKSG